jgi:hypothetical protein
MIEHLNMIPYATFLFCDGESAKTKLECVIKPPMVEDSEDPNKEPRTSP